MKIYYWSPFTSKVATIKAVINSAYGLRKYFKIETSIINSSGEWNSYRKKLRQKNVKIINFNNNTKNKIEIEGFVKSRLIYIKIFIFSFFPLLNLLKKNKPDYMVVHLITSLPLILFFFFKFETKLILRISGLPKLNLIRKLLWKLAKNKIYLITVPTKDTLKYLNKNKIFESNKILYLPDPVYDEKEISLRFKRNSIFFKNYILNIGRLTRQKNQKLLIEAFEKISKKYSQLKLLILGDGEKYHELKNLVHQLNLNKKVKLLGHVNNPYEYISKCRCLVSTSLWEDPGFVMIEAARLKKIVISSNCPNGPKEFLKNGKAGYLFKNNNEYDFVKKFNLFINEKKNIIKRKISRAKENSKKYSILNHSKRFSKFIK